MFQKKFVQKIKLNKCTQRSNSILGEYLNKYGEFKKLENSEKNPQNDYFNQFLKTCKRTKLVESKELKMKINTYDISTPDFEKIPRLKHGLEKIVKDPGVVYGVDRFPSYLKNIHQPNEIRTENYCVFVTPSQDEKLHAYAEKENSLFTSSTSSLTGVLSQIYFLLSNYKPTYSNYLKMFQYEKNPKAFQFTAFTKKPVLISLKKKKNVYSINSDKAIHCESIVNKLYTISSSEETILSELGKSMENMLCMTHTEFDEFFLKSSNQQKEYSQHNFYRYFKFNNFLIRSQLDCYSPSIENKNKFKVFDIKTRAIDKIRYNIADFQNHLDYNLTKLTGINKLLTQDKTHMKRNFMIWCDLVGSSTPFRQRWEIWMEYLLHTTTQGASLVLNISNYQLLINTFLGLSTWESNFTTFHY
jgi:hypothetical protein